jgi:cytochrome c553
MTKATPFKRHAIALSVALLLAACSQSQVENSADSAADPGHASGEHGSGSADGNQPIDPTYPKLGGQYGDYLAHALQAYRAGDRQHPLMTGQATDLSDQDIADLAAYFGSRPSQLRDLHGLK